MNDTFQYRLTKSEKREIAQNLIEILQKDAEIKQQTSIFISNWILTASNEKRKAFFDVWEIVLKNYLPSERPILFRSCQRVSKKNKIASFTGRLECAKRFSDGKGTLIICDTNETLKFEEFSKADNYTKSFYPLFRVLIRAKNSGGSGFSERILNDYIGENEYIMKIDMENMQGLKWK
ncbi:hypothetical protein [Aestuariibaculum marinum]|uniref:Uncharacterized protein n=1 Tax=Aestuariibaculum marinum TaxID=2683592 RepID=A0A8J6PYM1_9FLAO|nr:hypothetical protein [Aestuariibaculum marinum]MBD0824446.1 hypothetical protein [Aestuariibaculum marinum]